MDYALKGVIMRAKYKNPKDLAICLKDHVDLYQDSLMDYEKLKVKVVKIISSSEEIFYKNGHINAKIAEVLEDSRIKIINQILEETK